MSGAGVIQVRIPDMPPASSPLSGQELIQIVQLGRSRKLQLGDLSVFQGGAWQFKTSSYTAQNGERIATGASMTLNLPASPGAGHTVEVADAVGWASNLVTLGRNGSTIMGLSEDLTLNISDLSLVVVFNGTTWRVSE